MSRFRSHTPKARLIPLSPPFLEYLREDGIVLPTDDEDPSPTWEDQDSGVYSEDRSDDEDDEALLDPSEHFRDIHVRIKDTITELGGKVVPKLNWSAPKDATWIAATNSMECWKPSDVYLLLKSSDFVTHDLEHAFDDCVDHVQPGSSGTDGTNTSLTTQDIPYHLILRKYLNFNPAVEFRCFVRDGIIIGICQRDLNYFEFLSPMILNLRARIQDFFRDVLKPAFPDSTFVFDVYMPPPHRRVWLIDINPWAPRTDPLLFSWLELLQLDISLPASSHANEQDEYAEESGRHASASDESESESESEADLPFVPEFRLVKKDDPEAYGFTTPQYSAHKLPKEVVDASKEGPGGIREFADQWKQILQQQEQEDET